MFLYIFLYYVKQMLLNLTDYLNYFKILMNLVEKLPSSPKSSTYSVLVLHFKEAAEINRYEAEFSKKEHYIISGINFLFLLCIVFFG